MPAASPFFPHGRVLCATHWNTFVIAGHTDIAANTFADFVFATFIDFVWQEWIRDRRPRRADEIENAALDLTDHHVRRCKTTDTDDGLRRQWFDEIVNWFLRAFFGKSSGCGFSNPARRLHVPQVRDVRQHRDDLVGFRRKRVSGQLK